MVGFAWRSRRSRMQGSPFGRRSGVVCSFFHLETRDLGDMRAEIANLGIRLSTDIAGVRTELPSFETRLVRRMVGTAIAMATVTVGILLGQPPRSPRPRRRSGPRSGARSAATTSSRPRSPTCRGRGGRCSSTRKAASGTTCRPMTGPRPP